MKVPPSRPVQPMFGFMQPDKPDKSKQITGIGTSNKSIEVFIAELKAAGVKLVVDVRARPYSRFYPHFNKDRLRDALRENDIEYEWHGDTLGNPEDKDGKRTLAGFKLYMKTDSYREGLEKVFKMAKDKRVPLALMCAEKNENECHRKFILDDVRKALKKD